MDQKSLQALLQELQGLDELPSAAADKPGDGVLEEAASDYTAWYEDYVKSASVPAPVLAPAVPQPDSAATAPPQAGSVLQNTPTDLRKLTYAQALPIITKLARDEPFLDALQDVSVCNSTECRWKPSNC